MSKQTVRSRCRGLTFIELLIVLVIVGMGWFTLVPNLDLAGDKEADDISLVNALIYEGRAVAVSTDTRQTIYIGFEKGVVEWGDEVATLPASVSSGHYNEEPIDGDGVNFAIYPEGFSDEVRLVLSDGMTLVLDPLSVRFEGM
ncbi:prepilin-type N-terminal cleavage/methylation domain-containing protein [Maridesulfovibrio hydrothermalis]|uniref:Prepilin-type N-terminal cleavage/methylation domain-containing protein n=1 Tax=Maridesulfovibrio hydrothermalis AM13 = DSM 14728 TaxID=1121451 RepID=L0RAL5_9BACT|nr:prepilin-type N-terminal cleavage/methylation domain-containing protein [Maridesulfovibrio hydrothermalis]CCO23257.1 conserved protein of unknown function [Maridesulfovibrio hydrothermalis AM13 = DSM 14728]